MTASPLQWRYPGARWWKFDFHTHTPASADYGKGTDQASLRQISAEDWLLAFMRAEVDCVAVTDHNSGDWIDRLSDTYAKLQAGRHPEFRPLHLFPGVEITANGGVHVLAILDPSRTGADINQLLGAVRFRGTRGSSDEAADASPKDVVEEIAKAGGISILAHVDRPTGAFRVLNGNTLAPLLDTPDLFAIEVCDPTTSKPEMYRQRKLAWAEVLGSDAHHAAGAAGQRCPGSHFTWVKMGSPSIEGLRLALLDGNDVSLRRSDSAPSGFDPFATPSHFIERVEIVDARYMGREAPERLEFSPWFNALVGGRGTGKSTVVHFLRLAYRREGQLTSLGDIESVARTFERFNHAPKSRDDYGGLSADDATTVQVVVMRDGERYRLTWRQDGQGPVVEEEDGAGWKRSPSQAITAERFPLRLFSQGQIAALSTDGSHALLDLIDQTVGASAEKAAIQEEERRFLALRANVRDLAGKVAGRDALNVQLADVRRKLDRFELQHHADVLKAYQLRTRQEREIARQFDAGAEFAKRIDSLASELAPDDAPAGLFDGGSATDRSASDLLSRLKEQVHRAADSVRATGKALADAVKGERDALTSTAWNLELQKTKQAYGDLIAALKAQGVADPSEYGQLVQDRQRLEGELAKLDSLEKQRQQVETQAQDALAKLGAARRRLSDKRSEFLQQTLANNPFVRIVLEPYGRDPRAVERSLREVLGAQDDRFADDILVIDAQGPKSGAVAGLIDKLPDDYEAARLEFEKRLQALKASLKAGCEGLGKLNFGGHFGNYIERQFRQRPEFLDRILLWYPDDSLKVEYSPKGDGSGFRPIGQASAGQRAAAMLAFLLAHGSEPIILDQPEDDLDNHLIYDLVVKQIRAGKHRRQIIAITHNPNVVVNGDAEMIHALDFRRGQCRVVQRGCLQEKSMREEICRVMEGGREAFERRYRRLGKD
ncbi:MAG: TrlF family AAA-like ATPase [Pseudomonadota bacterium]